LQTYFHIISYYIVNLFFKFQYVTSLLKCDWNFYSIILFDC